MLTPRQAQLLRYLDERITQTGACPSYSEMMKVVALKSRSSISRLVRELEDLGFIRVFRAPRAIEVVRRLDGDATRGLVNALRDIEGLAATYCDPLSLGGDGNALLKQIKKNARAAIREAMGEES